MKSRLLTSIAVMAALSSISYAIPKINSNYEPIPTPKPSKNGTAKARRSKKKRK